MARMLDLLKMDGLPMLAKAIEEASGSPISRSYLSLIVNGWRPAPARVLYAIEKKTGVPMAEVFDFLNGVRLSRMDSGRKAA